MATTTPNYGLHVHSKSAGGDSFSDFVDNNNADMQAIDTAMAALAARKSGARGAYDAIVYIQDGDVIAEDAEGDEIEDGTAGTDDAAVINAAILAGSPGVILVKGSMTLKETVNVQTPMTSLIGDLPNNSDAGQQFGINCGVTTVWTVNTPIGIQVGDGATHMPGFVLKNLSFKSATQHANTAIKFSKADSIYCEGLSFKHFDKAMLFAGCWDSAFKFCHGFRNDYSVYATAENVSKFADPVFDTCLFSYNYIYSVYFEDNSVWHPHFKECIIENRNDLNYYGGCSWLGAGCNNASYDNCYQSADYNRVVLQDAGQYTKIIGGMIHGGVLHIGNNGFIGNGTRIDDKSHIYLDGYDCKLISACLDTIDNSAGAAVDINKARAVVMGNTFLDSDCKYYIYINGGHRSVILGNVFNGLNVDNDIANSYAIYNNSGLYLQISNNHFNNANAVAQGYNIGVAKYNYGHTTEASGSSTGTGSEQTIAHGLVAAPSKVAIVPTVAGATVSNVWADATNIYCTVTTGKAFNWSADV